MSGYEGYRGMKALVSGYKRYDGGNAKIRRYGGRDCRGTNRRMRVLVKSIDFGVRGCAFTHIYSDISTLAYLCRYIVKIGK